jgi:hypothetical protein
MDLDSYDLHAISGALQWVKPAVHACRSGTALACNGGRQEGNVLPALLAGMRLPVPINITYQHDIYQHYIPWWWLCSSGLVQNQLQELLASHLQSV